MAKKTKSRNSVKSSAKRLAKAAEKAARALQRSAKAAERAAAAAEVASLGLSGSPQTPKKLVLDLSGLSQDEVARFQQFQTDFKTRILHLGDASYLAK